MERRRGGCQEVGRHAPPGLTGAGVTPGLTGGLADHAGQLFWTQCSARLACDRNARVRTPEVDKGSSFGAHGAHPDRFRSSHLALVFPLSCRCCMPLSLASCPFLPALSMLMPYCIVLLVVLHFHRRLHSPHPRPFPPLPLPLTTPIPPTFAFPSLSPLHHLPSRPTPSPPSLSVPLPFPPLHPLLSPPLLSPCPCPTRTLPLPSHSLAMPSSTYPTTLDSPTLSDDSSVCSVGGSHCPASEGTVRFRLL